MSIAEKVASMYNEVLIRERNFFYKAVMIVMISLLFSGLFGCGGTGKTHEIVSFYTSSYGMARKPEYAFALYRQDGAWYFSASCHVNSPYSHDTSFGSFPLPAKDAAGFLAVLREEGEIDRLQNYRTPLLTRLLASVFPISDGSTRYSGMTFADGSSLERNTRVSARVLDSLYDLAEKHCREAESVEIQAVSIRRDSPAPDGSYFFTLETDGYDWFLSFGAILDGAGGYTQAEELMIGTHDADKILRIIREGQLVTKVKQYEALADEGTTALEETICQISFRFADGSSICAPLDAGTEMVDAFYSLAETYSPLG